MKIETGMWVASFDSEGFTSDSGYYSQGALLEDIYHNLDDENRLEDILGTNWSEDDGFYMGQVEQAVLPSVSDEVVDSFCDKLYEECGDYSDDYIRDVRKAPIREKLDKVIQKVITDAVGFPTVYKLSELRYITLEQVRKTFDGVDNQ